MRKDLAYYVGLSVFFLIISACLQPLPDRQATCISDDTECLEVENPREDRDKEGTEEEWVYREHSPEEDGSTSNNDGEKSSASEDEEPADDDTKDNDKDIPRLEAVVVVGTKLPKVNDLLRNIEAKVRCLNNNCLPIKSKHYKLSCDVGYYSTGPGISCGHMANILSAEVDNGQKIQSKTTPRRLCAKNASMSVNTSRAIIHCKLAEKKFLWPDTTKKKNFELTKSILLNHSQICLRFTTSGNNLKLDTSDCQGHDARAVISLTKKK